MRWIYPLLLLWALAQVPTNAQGLPVGRRLVPTGRAMSRPPRRVSRPIQGMASYYGSRHSPRLIAAHRTLPLGTRVRVTNQMNGASVIVVINDRGPFRRGRIIDVSYAAARKLRLIERGVVMVRLEVLHR